MKRVSRECASEQRSVLARLASLAHIAELARRLPDSFHADTKNYSVKYEQLSDLYTANSLSFSSDLVRAVHARGSGEAARRTKRGGHTEKKKKESLFFVPLPSRAFSHARGHLRVSRFGRRTTEKRDTARSLSDYM